MFSGGGGRGYPDLGRIIGQPLLEIPGLGKAELWQLESDDFFIHWLASSVSQAMAGWQQPLNRESKIKWWLTSPT